MKKKLKVAVCSGKGGTGKTFVSANLTAVAEGATLIDCDVEEPNSRLFWPTETTEKTEVTVPIPSFNKERCTACRACVDACRFHALFFVKNAPRLIPSICHGCGACRIVCPAMAVGETARPVGVVEKGKSGTHTVITGVLNIGEASPVPVIRGALQEGEHIPSSLTVIDAPPGSGCAVTESVKDADFCILVTEPTAFGLHNLRMVRELAKLLHVPAGVVINKAGDTPYPPLLAYCKEENLPILMEIPFEKSLAAAIAEGTLATSVSPRLKEQFLTLLHTLEGGARP